MKTSEMEGSVCVFCASPCSPTFTIVDGEIIRLKSEHHHTWQSIPFLVDEENPPLLSEQLTAILILKNILGIKEEKLCEFLGKLEGHFHPQFWLQVCSSCEETVSEYYTVLKEFLKLEKKLTVISDELKRQIRETAHMNLDSDDGDGVAAQVWSEVRAEVLKEIENTDQETPAEISSAGPVLNQDELNHASIIDGLRLTKGTKKIRYKHKNKICRGDWLRMGKGKKKADCDR